MKRIFTAALLMAAMTSTNAQTTQKSVGGYGTPFAEITTVNGKVALNVGGQGGVLLNHRWLIGASGNNIFFEQKGQQGYQDFQFAYYGLYNEYRFKPAAKVFASVGLTTGAGLVTYKTSETQSGTREKIWRKDGHWTHVIQPTLALNIPLLPFMQARIHAGYRFTGNHEGTMYKAENLNGFSGGAGLSFGKF